jgi:hypothetical protein
MDGMVKNHIKANRICKIKICQNQNWLPRFLISALTIKSIQNNKIESINTAAQIITGINSSAAVIEGKKNTTIAAIKRRIAEILKGVNI